MTQSPSPQRYLEIDLVRTIAILFMIVYHVSIDLAFFYSFPIDPLTGNWRHFQELIATLFLLTVGVSFSLSYARMEARRAGKREIFVKYAKRGLLLIACGMGITAVTFPFLGDSWIRFGILHMIGTAILLLPFLMPFREGNFFLAVVLLLLGSMMGNLHSDNPVLLPFGLASASFASADYFPLVPWLSPVLIGVAAGNFLYVQKFLKRHLPEMPFTRLLTLPGRYALLIYLFHQPILLGILWVFLGKPNF